MKRSLVIILLLVQILAGCGLKTQTLPEFYEKDLADVTKIIIVDGSSGHQKEIKDKASVDEFLAKIKKIKFIPEKNQEKRDGWRYSIRLYQDGKKEFQFELSNVEGNYYYTKPDIYPIVDEVYKSLD